MGRRRRLLAIPVVLAVVAVSLPAARAGADAGGLAVGVVSSPAHVVTGGDALVRVSPPKGSGVTLDPADVEVRVDGTGVPADTFAPDPRSPGAVTGLLHGLDPGEHAVTTSLRSGGLRPGRVELVDHPADQPVVSGPRQEPFACDTARFALVAGGTLGESDPPDCWVPSRVDKVYKATDGKLRPLTGDTVPDDAVTTVTSTGERVPYVLRVETGVVDRSVYEFAVLDSPGADAVSPRQPPTGWNGRMVYTFGGGCPGGWYQQGRSTGGVVQDGLVGRGYAVVSSSLNVFGQNCNSLLAAEVMSMVREHVVERIGAPLFTLGWGCSGGSYQVHLIGDQYPGLLDGMVAGCSFADIDFATVQTVTDAWLLDEYFTETARESFTEEQRTAVSGFANAGTIGNLAGAGKRIDPRVYCPEQLPVEDRYHPETNPDGARCDVYDHQVNIWGENADGDVRRPLSNVGVQYGLGALRDGDIGVDQFLDLNERVGGFDRDANVVAERTVADPAAVDVAYRSDQLMSGHGLAAVPIVDYREYTDDFASGDIHQRFQSFTVRERLVRANGDARNQVMLVESAEHGGFDPANPVVAEALTQLDTWLTGIARDERGGSARQRMLRNKPAELTDACWTRDDHTKVAERQRPGIGTTRCNTEYPVWTAPRQVAGASLANDVISCRLRAPSRADYPSMTAAQWQRLRTAFAGGVCDWTAPGVGQRPPEGTWYAAGS